MELGRIELKYNTKIQIIHSYNYAALREQNLGPAISSMRALFVKQKESKEV